MVGETGRYHIYTETAGWNVLMTSKGRLKFTGKLTVHGGTFQTVKPVGFEKKQDKLTVAPDKKSLEFDIQTWGSFDGFEFRVKEKDAWVEFELKQGGRKRPKRIFIGKYAANPKGIHFALPARTK